MSKHVEIPLVEVNRICDQFEQAWKTAENPSIAAFVSKASEVHQSMLLEELLAIDIEIRLRRFGEVDPQIYAGLGIAVVEKATILIEQTARSVDAIQSPGKIDPSSRVSCNDPGFDAKSNRSPSALQIGGYKLLQILGEGGMGAVWLAEQERPVRRRVAIKLIKAGLDHQQVLARFEAERQALAMMDHQNIAKVFDAGTTETGQPYFVMEWVEGISLTKYCNQNKLSLAERLELFIPVCKAVQHAHQKGIIHRDLKPLNVLVRLQDDKPIPKVIDFGLAKALQHQSQLTDKSIFTEFGQVVGTLQYMSPEQAELKSADIDTRTDVYSLGVMVYELLTGGTPIMKETLLNAPVLTVLETIRERDPPRPSARLSSLSDDAVNLVSDQRRIDSGRLKNILRGDLDWIVMKALEKDRARRYATASELADDIQRYLNDEAVEARPPSSRYRLGKFVKKNRGLVAASTTIAALLVAGIALSTWFAFAAERERKTTSIQKQLADRSAQRSADVLAIVTKSFTSVDPYAGSDAEMTAREVLINAQKSLKVSELDDEGRSLLLDTLTNSFIGIGEFNSAFESATEKLEIRQRLLGADHPDTLSSMIDLADVHVVSEHPAKAIDLLEPRLANIKEKLGKHHPDTLRWIATLAAAYRTSGRLKDAIPLFEETMIASKAVLGDDHPDTLRSVGNLALTYKMVGRVEEAIGLSEQILEDFKSVRGIDHPDTATLIGNLANAYEAAGDPQRAISLLEQTVKASQNKLGTEHPFTFTALNNLARCYTSAGQMDKAIPLFEQNLSTMKANLGEAHPHTLAAMANLADAYWSAERIDETVVLYENTLAAMKSALGDSHPETVVVMNNLAAAYARVRKFEKALPLFEQCLKSTESSFGRDHFETQLTVANLGTGHCDAGKYDEGIPLLEEAFQASKKYDELKWVRGKLRQSYSLAKRSSEYALMLDEELSELRRQLDAQSPELARRLANFGQELLQIGRHTQAELLLRESLSISQRSERNPWHRFFVQSLLGEALVGQEKFEVAKPMLVEAWEGLKSTSQDIPAESRSQILSGAVQRLIQLAEKTGNDSDLTRWQQELPPAKSAEDKE